MNIFWTIIILTEIISIGFLGIALWRYFSYKRRNTIIETKYSVLFRFIRSEHVVFAYIITISVYTVGSMMIILYLSSL